MVYLGFLDTKIIVSKFLISICQYFNNGELHTGSLVAGCRFCLYFRSTDYYFKMEKPEKGAAKTHFPLRVPVVIISGGICCTVKGLCL